MPRAGVLCGLPRSQTGHKSQGQVVPLVPSCCCLMVLCYATTFLGLARSPRDSVLYHPSSATEKCHGLPQNALLWRFCLSIAVAVSKIQDPVSVLFLNLRCQGRDVYSRIMWTSDLGRRMHRHQRDEREAHKLHDHGAATNLRPTRPRSIEDLACCVTAQH